jgi:flagellar biosynthesis protein FlhA
MMLPGEGRKRVCFECIQAERFGGEEITQAMLRIDPLVLEVGCDLSQLADPAKGGELLEWLRRVRRQVAMEYGVIVPGVCVRQGFSFRPGQYWLRIRGDLVASGDVRVEKLLGICPSLEIPKVEGESVRDPVHGHPAVWIVHDQEQEATSAGLEVFEPLDVLCTHVHEVIKKHLAELLTREDVAELLNLARKDAPTVLAELAPNLLGLGQIRQVLQALVSEGVSIRDLPAILNALADQAVYMKDPVALTEHVRVALRRRICQRYQSEDGNLYVFTLSSEAERVIQNSIQFVDNSHQLMMDPSHKSAFLTNLEDAIERYRERIPDAVILVNPRIRKHVKKLSLTAVPNLAVLSYAEIEPGVHVINLESIEVHSGGTAPGAANGPTVPPAGVPDAPTKTRSSPRAEDGSVRPPDGPDDDTNPGMSWAW